MLLLISAITFNAWADDDFHNEWKRVNTDLNKEDLMKGVDQNENVIDLRNQARQGIDPDVLGASHAETANVENSVKDKRPQELQAQGREAMSQNQEVTNLLGDLQQNVDRSQPGINSIFKKADKIAAKRASMDDNLSQYLKEKYGIDIECTSTLGKQSAIDTPFIMGEEVQEIRNETYEPQYCEHLLNTYDCTTDLHIKCIKPGSKLIDLHIVNSNVGYARNNNTIHIDHRYENQTRTVGGTTYSYSTSSSHGYGPSSTTHFLTYYYLAKAEVRIIFDIPFNPKNLGELALLNINFSHAIWITLNGRSVYPQNWSKLKFSHYVKRSTSNDRSGEYPLIETGRGIVIIGRETGPVNHIDGIDLKPFARRGHNELVIHGASIKNSHIILDIRAQEKTCLKWSEKWVETCVLQPS